MDGVESKTKQNPPRKTQKYAIATQISLRFLATMASLASAWIMFTTKQTVSIVGLELDARYSYSSSFKFLAIANVITCVFSVVSLFVSVFLTRNRSDPHNHFFMFLHDLVMKSMLIAGCAAATSIGLLGKYGNVHAGWMAICGNFGRFCNRITISVGLSYFSFIFYLILTIISANKSRKV